MATLPARTTASFDAIKPVSSLVLLDDELNQLVGASGILNGGTTGKKLLVKTSDGADPVIEMDQVGAGPIVEFKQNGTLKVSVNNAGQIVSGISTGTKPLDVTSTTVCTNLNADKVDGFDLEGNKTAFSYGWFISDPSTFPTAVANELPRFVCPAGSAITITEIKIGFAKGSHTAGGSVTLNFVLRTAASSWVATSSIGTINLDNTNNTIDVVYTNNIADQLLATNDVIEVGISARSGTVTERSVSIHMVGTQKFTT